jgi:hypothetical protein
VLTSGVPVETLGNKLLTIVARNIVLVSAVVAIMEIC